MTVRAFIPGLLVAAFAFVPDEPWITVAVRSAKIKAGKTVASYASPSGKAVLLLRDEGVEGDFKWYSLYLKQGRHSHFLDAYQAVSQLRWSKDSTDVSWHAKKAIDFNMLAHLEAMYPVGSNKLRWRILKREKVGT